MKYQIRHHKHGELMLAFQFVVVAFGQQLRARSASH